MKYRLEITTDDKSELERVLKVDDYIIAIDAYLEGLREIWKYSNDAERIEKAMFARDLLLETLNSYDIKIF